MADGLTPGIRASRSYRQRQREKYARYETALKRIADAEVFTDAERRLQDIAMEAL